MLVVGCCWKCTADLWQNLVWWFLGNTCIYLLVDSISDSDCAFQFDRKSTAKQSNWALASAQSNPAREYFLKVAVWNSLDKLLIWHGLRF